MAKSSSKEFSVEELDSASAWELPIITRRGSGDGDYSPNSVLTADEIETIQQQAYDEAFQQGRQEGLDAGQKEIKNRLKQFEKLIGSLDKPFENLDASVEEELVALAMLVARQLVRRELKIDPGQVIAVVREAMAILPVSSQKVSLHLHPDDAELVRAAFALEDAELSWKVTEDPLLTRGGCEIVTETSRIDATIEKRLAAVISTAFGGERGEDES